MPTGKARGRLVVSAAVRDATVLQLRAARGKDGPHEGLALWAGRTDGPDTIVVASVAPRTEHSWGRVVAGAADIAAAARKARALGLGIVAQVHSHPGDWTDHSEGDDQLVLLPFEGMFSLVVANYGRGGIQPGGSVGVHQFQTSQWVKVSNDGTTLIVVSAVIS